MQNAKRKIKEDNLEVGNEQRTMNDKQTNEIASALPRNDNLVVNYELLTINYKLKLFKGYTLIELMIIISVILILSAMAIPGFESLRDRAAIFRAKETFNALRIAQNLYRQNHSSMYYADNTNQLIDYTNVTSVLQRNFFGAPSSLAIQVNNKDEGLGYTITANALDSNKTPVTATEQKVYP